MPLTKSAFCLILDERRRGGLSELFVLVKNQLSAGAGNKAEVGGEGENNNGEVEGP